MDGVRSHPWFSCINWELLEDKDAQPPFVPDVSISIRTLAALTSQLTS